MYVFYQVLKNIKIHRYKYNTACTIQIKSFEYKWRIVYTYFYEYTII